MPGRTIRAGHVDCANWATCCGRKASEPVRRPPLVVAATAFREATEPPLHRHAHQTEHLSRRAVVLGMLIERSAEPRLLEGMVDVRRGCLGGTPQPCPSTRSA
jgi:hypothetical protein